MHIFPVQKDLFDSCNPLRTCQSYSKDCSNALEGSNSHGVNGYTLLSKLKYYKPTECTNIDYMHSILEGVIKRCFKFWCEDTVPKGHEYNFSLKIHKNEIDKRLLKVRVPSFVPTTPRSFLDYKLWRAKEFLSFLVYYLLPIFYDLMESVFLSNIVKLVIASECLLNREISKSELNNVKSLLRDFVIGAEELYSESIMLSGMHELLHIVDCTISFGPMNSVCCFQYEEINRKILHLIHSNDLVCAEFLLNFSVLQSLESYCESYTSNEKFNEFILKHKIVKTSNKKRISKDECLLGLLKNINDQDFLKMSEYLGSKNLKHSEFNSCSRLTYNGVLYTSSSNTSKRCDFCVSIGSLYGLIDSIIVFKSKIYVIVKRIDHLLSPFYDKKYRKTCTNIFLCNITDESFVTIINELKKAVLIKVNDDLCFISTTSISHLFL